MKPYRAISTDDHLMEPPEGYSSRMSKKWGDKVPHIQYNADGTEGWSIYGKITTGLAGYTFVQGVMPDREPVMHWSEVPTKAYVPAERVQAMEADGVDVHSLYPNVAGAAGGTFSNPEFDEEYRLEAIRAVNAIQAEEYVQPFPDRFIALTVVPLWDPKKALAEFQWGAKRGMKGVAFSMPQQFGYPHVADPAWDPLWAALQEADLPLHLHIGSGGSMGLGAQTWEGQTESQVRLAEVSTKSISANTTVVATMLFSGIFERFPGLKVMFAESGAGWAPYLLDVADHQWERQRLFNHGKAMKPSDLFRQHCYTNFWFEHIGDELRRSPGLANITWLSDFPHPTASYPTSWKYIEECLKDCTPEERQMILVDTPRRLYHLPEGYEERGSVRADAQPAAST